MAKTSGTPIATTTPRSRPAAFGDTLPPGTWDAGPPVAVPPFEFCDQCDACD
jgi:hypothetical protein